MEILSSPFAGVLGIVHIVLFIWALLQILGSSMDGLSKILWGTIVLLFPIVGLILYILIGRKV